jgi:heme A synthase
MIGGLVAMFAGSAWARAAHRYGVTVFAILLFLLALRRSGERAGRLSERLDTTEKVNDVQRQMLEAASCRPRSRDDLAERLRDGRF